MESVMIDSSVIRAHACAAGAPHERGGKPHRHLATAGAGLERAKPGPLGLSSKLHVSVVALGNPLRFLLTAGQAHEAPHARALLTGYEPDFVLGDKGYDAEHIRTTIAKNGAQAVIPPRSNRKDPSAYDPGLYKERHLIECFIGKFKHFRRCFARFDRLAELGPAGRALPVLAQLPRLPSLRLDSRIVTLICQHNLELPLKVIWLMGGYRLSLHSSCLTCVPTHHEVNALPLMWSRLQSLLSCRQGTLEARRL